MLNLIIIFLLVLFINQKSLTQDKENEMPQPVPVKYVDLQKYAGKWYEIARIPNRFQKDCAGNTTANYTLREDGRIDVVNKCIEDDGDEDKAEGIARIVDTKSNSKLEVSFVQIFGFSLFWGDYWIIDLEKEYQYAVVGHPERKYGWILSRTPELSENQLQDIFESLRLQGYDPQKFVMTPQTKGSL